MRTTGAEHRVDLHLTRALACKLAQYGITVNCLSPGQIPKPGLNAFTRENF